MDETGLHYLRARYYDPAVGRFLSEDPLPLLQRYPYVENSPINLTDPSGLCVFGAPCPDVVEDAKDEVGDLISAADNALDDYSDAVNGVLDNLGYADLNGIVCWNGTCVTAGLQASFSEGLHPYWGTGAGTNQGGLSFTVAPGQHINTGLNCGHQHTVTIPGSRWGGTVQYGVQEPLSPYESSNPFDYWFVEGGVSYSFFASNTYSWSATCYWVY